MEKPKIFAMPFARIYPLYIAKVASAFIEEMLLYKQDQISNWQRRFRRSYCDEHREYVFTGKLGALLTPCNLSRYFRGFKRKIKKSLLAK